MKHLFSVVVIGLGISVAVAAEPYDFFRNVQYPRTRRQDVGLDRVEQAGGPDAVGYNKRVVDWWPKKGIDVLDIPEGVPVRMPPAGTHQVPVPPHRLPRGMRNPHQARRAHTEVGAGLFHALDVRVDRQCCENRCSFSFAAA
jgi:hypothetical protein